MTNSRFDSDGDAFSIGWLQTRSQSLIFTWLLLTLLGFVTALMLSGIHSGWRIPGSAILRIVPTFAMAMFAGRGGATGLRLSLISGTIAYLMSVLHWFPLSVPAWTALILLGPALDVAYSCSEKLQIPGYLLAALAGCIANSFAFVIRMLIGQGVTSFGAATESQIHTLQQFDFPVLVSFAMCGALAGVLSAIPKRHVHVSA